MCQRLSLPMLDTPATSYIGALEARREIEMRFEATLAEFGANAFYATPTILRTAPRVPTDLDDQDALLDEMRKGIYNTALFNMTHQPAVSVPNGMGANELPTALQITGRLWEDAAVLQLAHAYQTVTPFHLERPPL